MPSVSQGWKRWFFAALVASASCSGGPEYPNCENDQHCNRDGHRGFCIQARCQQCRNTSDCGEGQTCLRNRCVQGVNACDGDNDCLANQRCDNNRCVPRTECDENRACSEGRRCDAGRCVADFATTDPVDNHGSQCTLDPPMFSFDDNGLDESARALLQRVADCLQRERTTRYVLIGRADPRGDQEYNLSLGERRARAVQRYLLSLGVLPDRIAVSSEGDLAATGSDEDGWRHDRRVDFRLRQ